MKFSKDFKDTETKISVSFVIHLHVEKCKIMSDEFS